MDWTESHRPRTLKDLVGNGPTIGKLKAWAEAWENGTPATKAVILAGTPGTGKTSAALALGHDMGWPIIELNASDARNAETIRKVATAGAVHQTFGEDGSFHAAGEEGGRKLIILDEADNLYERLSGENAAGGGSDLSDRGGKSQIIETIRQSKQPIILIVNDLYALQKGSGAALKSLAETLKFNRVNVRSIPNALARICQEEGIQCDRDVLESIAVRAEGDMRSAVRDLESIALGRTRITSKDLASLGKRDTSAYIFDVVRHVLKGRKMEDVRREVWDVDATPEDLVLWIDENLPKEYKHPEDLVRGYDMLSRADVFLGRTRRKQNYGLWSYAGELATIGVMAQRQHEYRGFSPFGFPQWLSKMSRSRGTRQAKEVLAANLGAATHQSRRKARAEQVEVFQALFQADEEFAIHMSFKLELTEDQIGALLDAKKASKQVKTIVAGVQALEEAHANEPRPVKRAPGGLGSFGGNDEPAPAPAKKAEPEEKPAEKPKPSPGDGQRTLF